MPKLDKNLYTKSEFKQALAQRKKEKAVVTKTVIPKENTPINVLCLKHGNKYPSYYVNILYNMISKNISKDFNFFCLTEDKTDLQKNIITLDLPMMPHVTGWWYKPYIFSNELPIDGIILYLDLDIVICNNIDKLFNYKEGKFCIIRDFTRAIRPNWEKFNSSVMRFQKGELNFVWEEFKKNHNSIIRRYHGDQDFLYDWTKNIATIYPDAWIKSWKWEIRKSKLFAPGGTRGNRKLQIIENIEAPKDCCIAVFHGDPNPHLCDDPYIKEKWR